MERYLLFITFFAILFSVFGFIQWYVYRSYIRWLARVVSVHGYYRFRAAGLAVLAVANILFILRFPSTELGWYQHPLFQALVIYPGGIFFGAIVLTFAALLVTNGLTAAIRLFRRWKGSESASSNYGVTVENAPSSENHTQPELVSARDHATASESAKEPAFHAANPAVGASTLTGNGFSRRQFLRTAGTAMIGAPVAFTIGASAHTAHDYQINRLRLHYPDLPSGLNGFRIVQLSDIHSGIYMTEQQMRDIFHLANEQHPDLVAITGDFVDNSPSEIPALYRTITDLKAEYGVYGCLGNHDHYASAPLVSSALRQQGVNLLTNDRQTLRINGESLTLLGVDDIEVGSPNSLRINQAMQNMPGDGFRILLSHRPDLFNDAQDRRIDLTLAGHTHGGQIGFEVMGVPFYPIHLFHEYAKGLYEIGQHKLYVNVGIGMVGVPVRLVRPELTVIELTNQA